MKIGLTYTGSDEKHSNYERWLKHNEHMEIIKFEKGQIDANQIKNCDALVLSGGVDIHPKYYGSKKFDYKNKPAKFQEERDEFEISIFKMAQENNLPVLGVCRGFQLINCVFGGSINQNLGTGLNKIHWRIRESEKRELDKAHGLNIESDTLLNEIVKIERGVVNSAHHQAIKRLADNLKINCKSDDGIIEGFEWLDKSNKSFLLCIQWHPERMFKFYLEETPLSKKIKDRFIEEIQKSKKSKK
jgi:putative glutamine amidotransferase